MTSKEIHEAMANRFCPTQWIYVKEFSLKTGFDWNGFVDSAAFNLWPSGDDAHKLLVFEIKVSRSDFRAEMKNPKKRANAVKVADEFYFVAPKGMLKPSEIPHEAGLFEVSTDGTVRKRIGPPKPNWDAKRPTTLPRGIMAAIVRKADPRWLEATIRMKIGGEHMEAKRLLEASRARALCGMEELRLV